MGKKQNINSGFTIVELLVVIVVIGILAAISLVSYAGINQRAIGARIASDLSNNSKLLELYKVEHDEYPATIDDGTGGTNCPVTPVEDNKYCLITSGDDDTLTYESNGDTYTLTITDENSDITYEIIPGGVAVAVDNGSGSSSSTFIKALGGVDYEQMHSVVQTSDGGYAMTGYTDGYGAGEGDAFIAKFTSDGALSWSKTWGGVGYDEAYSITATSDGGFAIAGDTASYGSGSNEAFIAKYTSNGTLSWDRTWGGIDDEQANSIIQTSDGGLAIAGGTCSYNDEFGDAFIAKFTSEGTLSWDKTWGGAASEAANSIAQTSDGDFVIAGDSYSYGAGGDDAFIAKFTSGGSFSWDRTWGGAGSDYARSITQASDGGFAMAGSTINSDTGNEAAFIAKYSSDGTLSWDKTWGGIIRDFAKSIVNTSDGGLAITGDTISYGAGGNDAFIAKYTSDGTLSWDKTWGGAGSDGANSIIRTSDSGFAIVGGTWNYGAGNGDTFIAKYDPSGNIEGCPESMCKDVSASVLNPSATVTDPAASVNDPTASVSDPTADASSTDAVATSIAPIAPPLTMTVTFSAQELYVAWPGDDQTVCKEWTTPPGKMVKGFIVSQETEDSYDFFIVSLDGVEKYNKSGYKTDEYVNTSAAPGTTLSACMSADESTQDGYGGQVTGVLYD